MRQTDRAIKRARKKSLFSHILQVWYFVFNFGILEFDICILAKMLDCIEMTKKRVHGTPQRRICRIVVERSS